MTVVLEGRAAMAWLRKILWRMLEPEVQTVVTERLVAFHGALLERGQIRPALDPGPAPEVGVGTSPQRGVG